jgi:ketosteroid isomerase-like protein
MSVKMRTASALWDILRPRLMTTTVMRRQALVVLALLSIACTGNRDALTPAERRAVADTLEGMIKRAYDLSAPRTDAVNRLLSLYPDSGRVVSASGGRMLTSRDSLAAGIRYFWESTGQNMREPRWIWERMVTDVLGRDAAVVTATYRVPHRTPRGAPHELAGAMTLVFARRGGRWVVVQEHLSDRPMPEADMSPMLPDTTRRQD